MLRAVVLTDTAEAGLPNGAYTAMAITAMMVRSNVTWRCHQTNKISMAVSPGPQSTGTSKPCTHRLIPKIEIARIEDSLWKYHLRLAWSILDAAATQKNAQSKIHKCRTFGGME
eukprot:1120683-Amphidinium_carterae.1